MAKSAEEELHVMTNTVEETEEDYCNRARDKPVTIRSLARIIGLSEGKKNRKKEPIRGQKCSRAGGPEPLQACKELEYDTAGTYLSNSCR
jgi:hypothetical protein